MEQISEKIRNNAMIAYAFWILFLLSKNPDLNNDFVNKHSKTSIFIWLAFLVNTIIFAYFWLGFSYTFLGYNISDIIAISIYLILFFIMVFGIYKAYKYETFTISESLDFKKNKKLFDISENWKITEKDKLTIILSLIPFIWYIIYPKYKKNILIENNTKLNLISTFIIVILFIFGNPNLSTILLLAYIIFIVFSAINLFTQDKIINFNLSFISTYFDLKNYLKSLKKYLWNYFKNSKEFEEFNKILEEIKKENLLEKNKKEKELQEKNSFKLSKKIIYIPIVNLISVFNLDVKQKKHIINWMLISLASILIIVLDILYWNFNNYLLLLLFPIFFWIWYLQANIMNYEIPFLYEIFNIFLLIKNKIKSIFIKTKNIKNTVKEVNLKVWESNKKSV